MKLQLPPTWVCAAGLSEAFQPWVSLHHNWLIFWEELTMLYSSQISNVQPESALTPGYLMIVFLNG